MSEAARREPGAVPAGPRGAYAARAAGLLLVLGLSFAGRAMSQTETVGSAGMPSVYNVGVFGVGNRPEGFDVSGRIGATYSDNLARLPAEAHSETVPEAGVQLSIVDDRPHLRADVLSNIEYQYYTNHTYGNEVLGGLAGTALFKLVPEHFDWFVQDNFGQTRTSPIDAESPTNRQNVNLFSTGPDLIIPFGGPTSLTIDGRWSKATFQDSQTDNEQIAGILGISRKLSPDMSLAVKASAQHVTYDQAIGGSYDVRSAYLQYMAVGRRTILSTQLGYTALHQSLGEDSSQPMLAFSLSRMLSPRTTMILDAGTNYSDSAQQFRLSQSLGGITLGSNDTVVASDPLRSDHASLSWRFADERTTAQLRGEWLRERHTRFTEFDREQAGGILNLSHRVTTSVTLGLAGMYGRQHFTTQGISLDDWSAELTAAWRMSHSLSLLARAGRYRGTGSDVNTTTYTYEYTENRASLMLTYGRSR